MPNENQRQKREEESPLGSLLKLGLGVAAVGAAGYVAYKIFSDESPAPVTPHRTTSASSYSAPPQRRFQETESDPGSPVRDPTCSICCNKLALVAEKNEDIHVTPCGHVYCHYCIYKWLQTRRSCPTCMSTVSPKDTRKIYFS